MSNSRQMTSSTIAGSGRSAVGRFPDGGADGVQHVEARVVGAEDHHLAGDLSGRQARPLARRRRRSSYRLPDRASGAKLSRNAGTLAGEIAGRVEQVMRQCRGRPRRTGCCASASARRTRRRAPCWTGSNRARAGRSRQSVRRSARRHPPIHRRTVSRMRRSRLACRRT